MNFRPTDIDGCVIVEPERIEDERGFFARTYSTDEFQARGLEFTIVQSSVSYNERAGTLRGMHYQETPHAETKLVHCTRGRIVDVVVDIRRQSASYLRSVLVELSPENGRGIYIAEGLAHGFLSLEARTNVTYHISAPFVAHAARGLRWDDPSLAIPWPDVGRLTMSDRDVSWPIWVQ